LCGDLVEQRFRLLARSADEARRMRPGGDAAALADPLQDCAKRQLFTRHKAGGAFIEKHLEGAAKVLAIALLNQQTGKVGTASLVFAEGAHFFDGDVDA